jgi:hypothetical protein
VGISYLIQTHNSKPIYRAQIDTTARDLRVYFCGCSWKESRNRLKNGESSSLFPQAAKFWFVLSSLYTLHYKPLSLCPSPLSIPLFLPLYISPPQITISHPTMFFFSLLALSPWCVFVCDVVTDSVLPPTKAKQEIIKKGTRPSNELRPSVLG